MGRSTSIAFLWRLVARARHPWRVALHVPDAAAAAGQSARSRAAAVTAFNARGSRRASCAGFERATARRRWHASICRAARGEPLRVPVFGTSTVGTCCRDCCATARARRQEGPDGRHVPRPLAGGEYGSDRACAWPARLEAWLRAAFPRERDRCERGRRRRRRALRRVGRARLRAGAFDVVIVETAINDRAALLEREGRAQVLAATERLARGARVSTAPALVFPHSSAATSCRSASQTQPDAARAVQWDPTQEHTQFVACTTTFRASRGATPARVMAQRACSTRTPAVGRGASLLATGAVHFPWYTHQLVADAIAHEWVREHRAACAGRRAGAAAAAAVAVAAASADDDDASRRRARGARPRGPRPPSRCSRTAHAARTSRRTSPRSAAISRAARQPPPRSGGLATSPGTRAQATRGRTGGTFRASRSGGCPRRARART